jgi:C1A family cysteine protease
MANPLDLDKLRAELAAEGHPWVSDPNTSMAVLTEDQRRRRLGFTPPPGALSLDEAVALDAAAPRVTKEAILAESSFGALAAFDHRNINGQNYTTPVKNQGGCGSCVAFGTVAVLETTYRRAIGNPNLALDLSEAHLFYCHGGEDGRNCGNGWWPEAALDKVRDKGVTFESVYPYTGAQQACQVGSGWETNQARVTGKSKLDGRPAIKNWIATKGSVTGCFIVYQDFFSYSSGVYRHVSGDAAGGHCVEIVGYNDAQGCWICKNSWGTNWGEGGFFRIAYGECQIETWFGPFGADGVSLKQWTSDARISGAWSNDAERNAWVYVTGTGWKKLAADSAPMQHAMLLELLAAKGAQRPVNYFEDQGVIREVYAL